MNQHVVIRDETDADVSAITEVTIAAFKPLEISHQTEQYIIEALRAAKALAVSLVAEVEGRVVGHIAFSPVTISDGSRNWYGLGPVSVLPDYQRKGVGKALISEGLSRLKALKAQGCCLVGHPGYYQRFGFQNTPGLATAGEHVLFLPHEAAELRKARWQPAQPAASSPDCLWNPHVQPASFGGHPGLRPKQSGEDLSGLIKPPRQDLR